MLSHANLSEPMIISQITPMTHLILTDIDNAVEVWKGAIAVKGEKDIQILMMFKTHLLFMGQKFKQNKELITQ